MKKKLVYVSALFALLASTGCYYDNKEELYGTLAPDTSAVSFATDIQPMIQSNCATAGCHAANGQSPALTNYAQIFAQKDRIKARAVDGTPSPMPSSGLMSVANRNKITAWINKGAPNN